MKNKDAAYFENAIEITPRKVVVREPISLLEAHQETISIKNDRAKG